MTFGAALTCILATSAVGANFVDDGDFESATNVGILTPTSSPWFNPNNGDPHLLVPNVDIGEHDPFAGSGDAQLRYVSVNSRGYDGVLQQNIDLGAGWTPGNSYTVSFWYEVSKSFLTTTTTGYLSVDLNGEYVTSDLIMTNTSYAQYSATVTPTSQTGVLRFSFASAHYNDTMILDNVDVELASVATPVPLPASVSMGFTMLVGLGGLVAYRSRLGRKARCSGSMDSI